MQSLQDSHILPCRISPCRPCRILISCLVGFLLAGLVGFPYLPLQDFSLQALQDFYILTTLTVNHLTQIPPSAAELMLLEDLQAVFQTKLSPKPLKWMNPKSFAGGGIKLCHSTFELKPQILCRRQYKALPQYV